MRTNINQGRIQSLAVMIVMLINNDQTPYLTYYRILGLTVHATSTAILLANQFHCIRQLRWAIDLLKAHHVIRPQQVYPLKGIL